MKNRYGFFGGSFNPVTNAHINLANKIQKTFKLDKVIFIPMNDFYPKQGLIFANERYIMLKKAIEQFENLEVSDLELKEERNLSMLEAFRKICSIYNKSENYFILGSDNINKMTQTKELMNYNYIVLERNKYKSVENKFDVFLGNVHILRDNPYKEISSSEVRKLLKEEKYDMLKEMIPNEVLEYIKERNIYR